MADYLIYSFYQNGTFCLEDNLFYEDNKRLGYSEDEKDGSIVSNNHREVVNRLSELKELNIELKRKNKTLHKKNEELKQQVCNWIDKKLREIKPYNSELCRETLLELKKELQE